MSRKKTILVLGASGLLGRYVVASACHRSGLETHAAVWSRSLDLPSTKVHRADLRNAETVRQLLESVRPELVINCAGVVKSICDDGFEAALLNVALPHLVAQTVERFGGRLLHLSTDCVFSGRRGRYTEEDLPDPVDLYGRTKLAGEVLAAPHLTVRTSFIGIEVGAQRGLLGWFLAQKGSVPGFRRAIWSGLTADVLARVLLDLGDRSDVVGLLHVAGEAIDKASLLGLLARCFQKKDVVIETIDGPDCDRSLDAAKMRWLGISVPPMAQMIEECAIASLSRA